MGITNLMLLSYDTLKPSHLPGIELITNKFIIELKKFKDSHQCSSKIWSSWIKDLYGKHWPQENPPTTQAIINSTDRLIAKHKNLQKQQFSSKKNEIMFNFLQEYVLPQPRHTVSSQPTVCIHSENMLAKIQTQNEKIQQLQLKTYAVSRNAKKRQSRRDVLIEQQKADIKFQQIVIHNYKRKAESLKKKLGLNWLELIIMLHIGVQKLQTSRIRILPRKQSTLKK